MKPVLRLVSKPVTAPIEALERKVESTMLDVIKGLVRHLLTTIGGSLVASGAMSADDLNTVIGAALVIVGAVWSALKNRKPAES